MVNYPLPLLIIGSVFSSVCLVLVNKRVLMNFPFVFALSSLHFLCTAGLLYLMSVINLFELKFLPLYQNLFVGSLGIASICLMNFSLKTNSVGFYQMAKLCIIPTVIVLSKLQKGADANKTSKKIKLALCFLLLVVGIFSVTDMQLNFIGTILAILAVFSTSQYQIFQGSKVKEFELTGIQCACSVAVPQVFYGFILSMCFESQEIKETMKNSDIGGSSLVVLILVSCVLALSVNVHSFLLISRTSAVTFQVTGNLKTILVLLGGYALYGIENYNLLAKNVIGSAIALVGVILYSNIRLNETAEDKKDWLELYLPKTILEYLQENNEVEEEKDDGEEEEKLVVAVDQEANN